MGVPFIDKEYTLSQLGETARELLQRSQCFVFLFYAEMGAGKTTLIREMCSALGSTDNFSSPTFSIANEYVYPGGVIYHLDLYRVKEVSELLDLGIEEYFDSGNYCFVEWPQLAENLVEGDHIRVTIEPVNEARRLRAYYVEG